MPLLKKIKKFRVQARPASVLRGLKALMGGTQVTPELEKAVETEVERARELYSTAAVYNTFNRGEAPAWTESLWETKNDAGAKPVAVTLYAATIGAGLEGELGGALSRGEALRSQILTSLGEESAEQAAGFVYRLLAEEAKEESCELSPRAGAMEAGQQRDILSALEADKVQIQIDSQGHLLPRFTRAGYVLWWPPAKKRPK